MTPSAEKLGLFLPDGLHQDMLVYRRRTTTVQRVETSGVWVGVLDDITPFLKNEKLGLEPGDALLLYTDGVTEARRDGAMIGVEGLEAAFLSAVGVERTSRGIIDRLMSSLALQNNDDDVTLLAIIRQ